MPHARPIIIIRKKAAHGGHHGGAWKVAYADFVTAMMALFIVLWLLNSSKQIQVAVGGYFKDPTGTSKKVGNGQTGAGDSFTLTKDNMDKIKEELQKAVHKMTDFEKLKDQIEMTVTAEGLRIELMESEKGTFFASGMAEPSADGRQILVMLAHELAKLPNTLSIEGHTDSKPFAGSGSYSNWELSADRGNAARRMMQENGVGPRQVTQVRGYADQRLRKPKAPEDPSNRRISVVVQYVVKPEPEDKPAAASPAPPAKNSPASPAKNTPVPPAKKN
jgi:chemotaxis protein MotB